MGRQRPNSVSISLELESVEGSEQKVGEIVSEAVRIEANVSRGSASSLFEDGMVRKRHERRAVLCDVHNVLNILAT